jgi:hypothetical protein
MKWRYLCLVSFEKDTLLFVKGCEYTVRYNSMNDKLYIHALFGYTDIPKELLNDCFIRV